MLAAVVDFSARLLAQAFVERFPARAFSKRRAIAIEFVAVSRGETSMKWEQLPEAERESVIAVLEREAERLEQDAAHLERAAQQLGRPSLVERQASKADAFRASIEFLTRRQG